MSNVPPPPPPGGGFPPPPEPGGGFTPPPPPAGGFGTPPQPQQGGYAPYGQQPMGTGYGPERVGFGPRLGAFIIDWLIIGAMSLPGYLYLLTGAKEIEQCSDSISEFNGQLCEVPTGGTWAIASILWLAAFVGVLAYVGILGRQGGHGGPAVARSAPRRPEHGPAHRHRSGHRTVLRLDPLGHPLLPRLPLDAVGRPEADLARQDDVLGRGARLTPTPGGPRGDGLVSS